MGQRHPVLLYIHSISVTTTCSRSEHIFFPFYFIPNRFHTFTEQHTEEKISFNFNTVVVVPKALFLKWNFMSVIVAFHSITGWRWLERKQGKEKEKVRLKCDDGRKNCGFELWGIFLPLSTALFLCKKFLWKKKRVAILSFLEKNISRKNIPLDLN